MSDITKYYKFGQKKRINVGYEQVKIWVQQNNIHTVKQYRALFKAGKVPSCFPLDVAGYFKNEYEGHRIFFHHLLPKICTYEYAIDLVRRLNITSVSQYRRYVSTQQTNVYVYRLPLHPRTIWPDKWISFGHFFGTKTISAKKMHANFLPYKEALAYVHSLNLKKTTDWFEYASSGQRPEYIPRNPWDTYKKQYEGMRVWLGVDLAAAIDIRQDHSIPVLTLYNDPNDLSNIVKYMVFDGGKIQAHKVCKDNRWTMIRMYQYESYNVSEIMDVFRQNSSTVLDRTLVVNNYHNLLYELDMLLIRINLL